MNSHRLVFVDSLGYEIFYFSHLMISDSPFFSIDCFYSDLCHTMTTTPASIGPHSRKKVSYYYDYDVGNYYYG